MTDSGPLSIGERFKRLEDRMSRAEEQIIEMRLQAARAHIKLDAALTRFEAQFAKVYAGQPTMQDITDATLDLAKLALVSKFGTQSSAPAPTATTATVKTN